MNKVILMGRLTRDPDIRVTNGERQMSIARYTIAVDRRRRSNGEGNEPTADFISCVAFDRNADFAERYLKQGTKIAITGRIQTGSYTNKDGQKVYTTDVVVEECEFAESKNAAGSNAGGYTPSFNNGGNASTATAPAGDGFINIPDGVDDEGLPF